jgi:thioredoxin-related protein
MSKLIERFKKDPSPANRQRLQDYLKRHMMAVCLASADEREFLKTHQFSI